MSNFSIYPSAIDGYQQLPLLVDGVSPVRADDLNRYRSGIINIETTLGVAPQISDEFGAYNDVGARLDGIDEKILNITVPPALPAPTPSFADVVAIGGSTDEKITVGGISVGTISLAGVDGVVNWDMATGMMAKISLIEDSGFKAPTSISSGATYILIIEQDIDANIVWDSIFNFPNGIAPSLVASGTTTIISFISYDGTKLYSVAQDNF